MIKVHPITGEITVEYVVGDTATLFTLTRHSSITVGSGNGIYEEAPYYSNDYVIKSAVQGGSEWLNAAISINGDSSDIVVAKSGSLKGFSGAALNGWYETIDNRGDIEASGYGVAMNSYSAATNSGRISGEYGIMSGDKQVSITNEKGGIIEGKTGAIMFSGTDVQNTLVNHGLIEGNVSGGKTDALFAVKGGDGVETIVNRGVIKGEILLGGGDDRFDNRHGTVDHFIRGSLGNDTIVVDTAKTQLFEQLGEGTDTVKSTVSYKLSANVENLTLLGKHDINGTGNAEANIIGGTSGENTLSGKGGADMLSGFRGDDILSGGAGSDVFLFAKGTGHDVVTDFTHGEDHIDLSGLHGIVDFDQMMAHHIKASGGDLVIFDGNDSIRLEHVAKTELDFHDFYY